MFVALNVEESVALALDPPQGFGILPLSEGESPGSLVHCITASTLGFGPRGPGSIPGGPVKIALPGVPKVDRMDL